VHQRAATPRPRVHGRRSRTARSNERWAMDVTHVACGRDGWAHLTAVIDCHDREIIGYEFALRDRVQEAERRWRRRAWRDSARCVRPARQR
jgi:putative transposase